MPKVTVEKVYNLLLNEQEVHYLGSLIRFCVEEQGFTEGCQKFADNLFHLLQKENIVEDD